MGMLNIGHVSNYILIFVLIQTRVYRHIRCTLYIAVTVFLIPFSGF